MSETLVGGQIALGGDLCSQAMQVPRKMSIFGLKANFHKHKERLHREKLQKPQTSFQMLELPEYKGTFYMSKEIKDLWECEQGIVFMVSYSNQ